MKKMIRFVLDIIIIVIAALSLLSFTEIIAKREITINSYSALMFMFVWISWLVEKIVGDEDD